eukprot:1296690-Rhodomonas_salina.2
MQVPSWAYTPTRSQLLRAYAYRLPMQVLTRGCGTTRADPRGSRVGSMDPRVASYLSSYAFAMPCPVLTPSICPYQVYWHILVCGWRRSRWYVPRPCSIPSWY